METVTRLSTREVKQLLFRKIFLPILTELSNFNLNRNTTFNSTIKDGIALFILYKWDTSTRKLIACP